jgi:hypothetical protein
MSKSSTTNPTSMTFSTPCPRLAPTKKRSSWAMKNLSNCKGSGANSDVKINRDYADFTD